MMIVPEQYRTDLLALAEDHARNGGDGSLSAALVSVLGHGLDPAEQENALPSRVVAFSADGFTNKSERECFTSFRRNRPEAWIVYTSDTWSAAGAASRYESDEVFAASQRRAFAYVSHSAANAKTILAAYPLVVPRFWQREIEIAAMRWKTSVSAALHAVLEIGLAGFRKFQSQDAAHS